MAILLATDCEHLNLTDVGMSRIIMSVISMSVRRTWIARNKQEQDIMQRSHKVHGLEVLQGSLEKNSPKNVNFKTNKAIYARFFDKWEMYVKLMMFIST